VKFFNYITDYERYLALPGAAGEFERLAKHQSGISPAEQSPYEFSQRPPFRPRKPVLTRPEGATDTKVAQLYAQKSSSITQFLEGLETNLIHPYGLYSQRRTISPGSLAGSSTIPFNEPDSHLKYPFSMHSFYSYAIREIKDFILLFLFFGYGTYSRLIEGKLNLSDAIMGDIASLKGTSKTETINELTESTSEMLKILHSGTYQDAIKYATSMKPDWEPKKSSSWSILLSGILALQFNEEPPTPSNTKSEVHNEIELVDVLSIIFGDHATQLSVDVRGIQFAGHLPLDRRARVSDLEKWSYVHNLKMQSERQWVHQGRFTFNVYPSMLKAFFGSKSKIGSSLFNINCDDFKKVAAKQPSFMLQLPCTGMDQTPDKKYELWPKDGGLLDVKDSLRDITKGGHRVFITSRSSKNSNVPLFLTNIIACYGEVKPLGKNHRYGLTQSSIQEHPDLNEEALQRTAEKVTKDLGISKEKCVFALPHDQHSNKDVVIIVAECSENFISSGPSPEDGLEYHVINDLPSHFVFVIPLTEGQKLEQVIEKFILVKRRHTDTVRWPIPSEFLACQPSPDEVDKNQHTIELSLFEAFRRILAIAIGSWFLISNRQENADPELKSKFDEDYQGHVYRAIADGLDKSKRERAIIATEKDIYTKSLFSSYSRFTTAQVVNNELFTSPTLSDGQINKRSFFEISGDHADHGKPIPVKEEMLQTCSECHLLVGPSGQQGGWKTRRRRACKCSTILEKTQFNVSSKKGKVTLRVKDFRGVKKDLLPAPKYFTIGEKLERRIEAASELREQILEQAQAQNTTAQAIEREMIRQLIEEGRTEEEISGLFSEARQPVSGGAAIRWKSARRSWLRKHDYGASGTIESIRRSLGRIEKQKPDLTQAVQQLETSIQTGQTGTGAGCGISDCRSKQRSDPAYRCDHEPIVIYVAPTIRKQLTTEISRLIGQEGQLERRTRGLQRSRPSGLRKPRKKSAPDPTHGPVPPTYTRGKRDSHIVSFMKDIYGNSCQMCGYVSTYPNGQEYSEAAHIMPFTQFEHFDIPQNILILCERHHGEFDRGTIWIDTTGYYKQWHPDPMRNARMRQIFGFIIKHIDGNRTHQSREIHNKRLLVVAPSSSWPEGHQINPFYFEYRFKEQRAKHGWIRKRDFPLSSKPTARDICLSCDKKRGVDRPFASRGLCQECYERFASQDPLHFERFQLKALTRRGPYQGISQILHADLMPELAPDEWKRKPRHRRYRRW
jgi:hypothetical protein